MFRIATLITLSLCFCGCAAQKPAAARDSAAMHLGSADGQRYDPLAATGHAPSVLIFVLQDCPICNAYAPRIQRLAGQFAGRGVRFYLVQVDPAFSSADAAAHAREYGYTFPVLMDRGHELVKRLGVRAVPTAIVLDGQGEVQYKGRIDNRYFSLGKSREAATTDDLRKALAAVVEGKQVQVARTKVIGCAVPDVPQSPLTSR
jgi:peroxiredoxin